LSEVVRRKILEILYEKYNEDSDAYITNTELLNRLRCSESELRSNMKYLEESGYAKVIWSLGSEFASRILVDGIDLLEGRKEFDKTFTTPSVYIEHLEQKHYGEGPQIGYMGSGSSVTVIKNSFNEIYKELEKIELDKEHKQIAEKRIKEVEEELQKDDPSSTKVKAIIDFLKKNASSIVPMVVETIKKILGWKYGI